jgi:hypothetical protein
MIEIKPNIEHTSTCMSCNTELDNKDILWQGIHICVETICPFCKRRYLEDLKVGHATKNNYTIDLDTNELFGTEGSKGWLGNPLLQSLLYPSIDGNINLHVEKKKHYKKVVVINCIDFLYGHSLLKLLNAERENNQNLDLGVIVIVQDFIKWMVPTYVAEIWTVNIPLSKAQNYYPKLNELINKECERFDEIYVSKAYSHPSEFNIENFTGLQPNEINSSDTRITFIWRQDRIWVNNPYLIKLPKKIKLLKILFKPLVIVQKYKVLRLFNKLRKSFPRAKFSIVGLGQMYKFPHWIEDHRVNSFNLETEIKACEVYSKSTIIIGIHGSNMLLPSAHGGMVLDLMPIDKWGNFAQDILFNEKNNRLASYMYRFVPLETKINVLTKLITKQIIGYQHYKEQMVEDAFNLQEEYA